MWWIGGGAWVLLGSVFSALDAFLQGLVIFARQSRALRSWCAVLRAQTRPVHHQFYCRVIWLGGFNGESPLSISLYPSFWQRNISHGRFFFFFLNVVPSSQCSESQEDTQREGVRFRRALHYFFFSVRHLHTQLCLLLLKVLCFALSRQ